MLDGNRPGPTRAHRGSCQSPSLSSNCQASSQCSRQVGRRVRRRALGSAAAAREPEVRACLQRRARVSSARSLPLQLTSSPMAPKKVAFVLRSRVLEAPLFPAPQEVDSAEGRKSLVGRPFLPCGYRNVAEGALFFCPSGVRMGEGLAVEQLLGRHSRSRDEHMPLSNNWPGSHPIDGGRIRHLPDPEPATETPRPFPGGLRRRPRRRGGRGP